MKLLYGLLVAALITGMTSVSSFSTPIYATSPVFHHSIVHAPSIRPPTGSCPSTFTYCSNGDVGANVTSYSSNSVTVSVSGNVATSDLAGWSYQYNLFFKFSNGTWGVSQTTIEATPSGCYIGTGYGTNDSSETENSVTCSDVEENSPYWEVATGWNQGFLNGLTFYLNGSELYSLTEAEICTGFSNCSISQSHGAYFQSVFVGVDTSSPDALFTSLGASQSYSGAAKTTSYPYCTGEESNAVYTVYAASGSTWTDDVGNYGSSALSACI